MKWNFIFILSLFFIITTSCSSSDNDNMDDNTEEQIDNNPVDEEIDTSNYTKIYVQGAENIIPNYSIKNFLDHDYSSLYYYQELFNTENGGSYVLDYVDQGGQGMDSYPNVTIGGTKVGGSYYTSDENAVGMPVKLSDISETLNFEFKTSQENALDDDDKWMASINFIFDNYGTEDSEPVNDDRDYDLVVMHEYHRFDDSTEDNPLTASTTKTHWYFARNADGSIKPYVLTLNGTSYNYAVRYKFFINSGPKDNKSHVKFIPINESDIPPVLKVNVKDIIAATKSYLPYVNLTEDLRNLAESNIALPNAWLKSINAGYEMYTGESTIKVDKFKVNL